MPSAPTVVALARAVAYRILCKDCPCQLCRERRQKLGDLGLEPVALTHEDVARGRVPRFCDVRPLDEGIRRRLEEIGVAADGQTTHPYLKHVQCGCDTCRTDQSDLVKQSLEIKQLKGDLATTKHELELMTASRNALAARSEQRAQGMADEEIRRLKAELEIVADGKKAFAEESNQWRRHYYKIEDTLGKIRDYFGSKAFAEALAGGKKP